MNTRCKICHEEDCEVGSIPAADVATVVQALRDQYGRSLRWPLRDLARQFVHEVMDAGRLGDTEPHAEDWSPPLADAHDFGGPLASYQGEMRLWRAEEIGHYAAYALGRAGRLLPERKDRADPSWTLEG